MDTALKFSGYFGAVLLFFGIVWGVLAGSFVREPVVMLHIVVGFMALIAWVVTSGVRVVSDAGQVLSGRAARLGSNAVLYTAVFVGLVAAANVFVALNDKQWDLTEQGVHSLSERSATLVRGLKQPLKVTALDIAGVTDHDRTEALLALYRSQNKGLFSFEFIDAQTNPTQVAGLKFKPGNLLLLEYGEGASSVQSRINAVDEQSVTNAILKLTRGAAKKLYYVQGHGEPDLGAAREGGMNQFAEALADEHVEVTGLLLAQRGAVPEDAAAVVLVDPKRALMQSERDALIQYAEKGGRLLLFANPENRESGDVKALAQHFGIEVGDDVVIDEQLRLFAGPQMAVQFVAQGVEPHPVTAALTKAEPPVFLFSSSVTAPKEKERDPSGKITYTELVKTGPTAWAEKNLALIFESEAPTAARDPEDGRAPVAVAVALEKKLDAASDGAPSGEKVEKAMRVVVFGDASWVQNGNLPAMGNRDLAMGAVNWLVGEEASVAIGPKGFRGSTQPIAESVFKQLVLVSFLGPELLLLCGLFIWWRRRSNYASTAAA